MRTWTDASWLLGRVRGIELRIHWLFVALVAFLALGEAAIDGAAGALSVVLQLGALFACVTLHELGHALTAQWLGVYVRRITLWPLGGVAEMDGEGLVDKPKAELLITAAGPAVNVALAVLLAPVAVLGLSQGWVWPLWLLAINVIMAVFNLLPAFPMDGGRLLRASLTMWRGDALWATEAAVRVGRVTALGLALLGLVANPWLLLIAWFVWSAGGRELQAMRWRAARRQLGPLWFQRPRYGQGW